MLSPSMLALPHLLFSALTKQTASNQMVLLRRSTSSRPRNGNQHCLACTSRYQPDRLRGAAPHWASQTGVVGWWGCAVVFEQNCEGACHPLAVHAGLVVPAVDTAWHSASCCMVVLGTVCALRSAGGTLFGTVCALRSAGGTLLGIVCALCEGTCLALRVKCACF